MTKDDTIRLAVEADLWDIRDDTEDPAFAKLRVLIERFAALVAAAERDACARICEDEKSMVIEPLRTYTADEMARSAIATRKYLAKRIRARSQS